MVNSNNKAEADPRFSERSGFSAQYVNLAAVMMRPKKQIRAELYISGDRAKAFFGLLKGQKDAIEREFGYPLEWEELPSRRDAGSRPTPMLHDQKLMNDLLGTKESLYVGSFVVPGR